MSKLWTRVCLVSVFAVVSWGSYSGPAGASTALFCEQIFLKNDSTEPRNTIDQLIKQKLSSLPRLRDELLRVANDSYTPERVRRVIALGLSEPDLSVFKFTRELARAVGVSETTVAFASIVTPEIELINPASPKSSQGELVGSSSDSGQRPKESDTDGSHPLFKAIQDGKSSIVVADLPNELQNHDKEVLEALLSVVHELAHIRFEQFLIRNRAALLAKIPHSLMREEDASAARSNNPKLLINRDFWQFLTERYAFEQERNIWLAVRASKRAAAVQETSTPQRINPERVRTRRRKETQEWLSGHIFERYRITDPQVLVLRDYLLVEILTGKPWLRQESSSSTPVLPRDFLDR